MLNHDLLCTSLLGGGSLTLVLQGSNGWSTPIDTDMFGGGMVYVTDYSVVSPSDFPYSSVYGSFNILRDGSISVSTNTGDDIIYILSNVTQNSLLGTYIDVTSKFLEEGGTIASGDIYEVTGTLVY